MRLGLTATVPVEIILAAGLIPVDLNNIFITSESPSRLVSSAEAQGFSHGVCSWIKGIYSAVFEQEINKIIAVTGGDCSNTIALGEVLDSRGIDVIHFSYPLSRRRADLEKEMENLRLILSASWNEIYRIRSRLESIREKLSLIDYLTYRDNIVTGGENHFFLVRSSDFGGDPDGFEKELDEFLELARKRIPMTEEIRLGYLGVPPIFSGLYEKVESMGARVVFNEVQRQFSMPCSRGDMVDQYLAYTYPYSVEGRIKDITHAIEERSLDGLIHYTQTFCYRQLYDILIRERLPIPVLTLEGDKPGPLDSRISLRLETFIEMLRTRKEE
ncbi:MAG: 2-hydroxyacyl-CoA dehydratase [Desulfobacteraceae bacterium]|nr:MAG: 2-hydroxyacyl-CoA dehydratase [Desulfobacteraceae bacterium]